MTDEARAGDARLADRIRSGETQALGELYDRYGGTALATALRVVGSREEAEDVVHEAFVTMWRKIDRFDDQRGSLRAWLMTVVRNMADDLQTLPADRHYALWLIHADGTTVRTGAVTDTQGVSVAPLEDVLSGAVTFAVTVEEHVVEAPSSEPVLTAQLGA